MPYVEGFGTWPFGEEWLWEAVACVLPAAARRCSTARPVTIGLTPVLCDQLEAMRGEPGDRYLRFLRDVRARGPRRGLGGPRARRRARARRRGAPRGGRLRARRGGVRAPRPRPRSAPSARSAAWSSGPRPPPTPCCRCWPPTPACGSSWPRASPRTGAASAAGTAGSGCPSAPTRPGSSARSREHGVRRFCVDQTDGARARRARAARAGGARLGRRGRARGLADGRARVERPRRLSRPPRLPRLPPPHGPRPAALGELGGAPYDREAALALAREHARDFVRQRGASGPRAAASCAARSTPSCSATGGTRARRGSRRCWTRPRGRARAGDGGRGRRAHARRGARARSPPPGGADKDLSTWDAHGGGRAGLRRPPGRAAHRGRRGRRRGGRRGARARRARAARAPVERLGLHDHRARWPPTTRCGAPPSTARSTTPHSPL